MSTTASTWLRLALLLLISALPACAGTAERLVDRAGRAAEREAGERVVRGVGAAADAAEGSDDEEAAPGGEAPGSAGSAASGPPDLPRGGEGAAGAYDFTRGERPIFVDDFSGDHVGDFPRNLTLLNGNWDVVEWQGQRWLRGTGGRGSAFQVHLPETLPERFTIEFDAMLTQTNQAFILMTSAPDGPWNSHEAALVYVYKHGTGVRIPAERREITAAVRSGSSRVMDRPTPIRVMVDGNHMKVFAGEQRVSNVPNGVVRRSDILHFQDVYASSPDNPIFVGPIRVDAGGRDLYGELEREGRVAVRGILFDTDSDRIRPESQATLDEIGSMLREHADLRLSIEGHTDAQGSEEHNRDLSQRRAEAVRGWLLDQYGLDDGRLRAVGMGEARPVAPNDTPEGRQQNRRVELVQIR